jgi:hypothetical protein
VADLKLDEDLTCPGDALFVDGDGIKIDLQGHTITGAGVGVGSPSGGITTCPSPAAPFRTS